MGDPKEVARTRDLFSVKRADRLIELPAKVGEPVYVIANCEKVCMNHDNDYLTGTGATTCPYEKSCNFEDCEDTNRRVFATTIERYIIDVDGIWVIFF